MIFPQHRCIHVHIPKTAGQAIRVALGGGVANVDRFPVSAPDAGLKGTHLTAEEMRSHDPEKLWETYFTFSIVRNPWDRAVSEFLWRRGRIGVRRSFETFEEFLRAALAGWEHESDDARHVMPQHAFVCSGSGELLVDYLARYETLDRDLEAIFDRIGLPFRGLPRVNPSISVEAGRESLWTPDTRSLLEELWGDDIERFGYEFPKAALSSVGAPFVRASPDPVKSVSTTKPLLFLHIGHGKTGSTTIQRALMEEADAIRARGLLIADGDLAFPTAGPVVRHPLLPLKRLMQELALDEAKEELSRSVQPLLEACRSGRFRGGIISSENLSQPSGATLFATLAGMVDLRVIYYVRRQERWMESAWKQWGLKKGQSIEEYARDLMGNGQPDFLKRARAWREVATDLTVVPLDGIPDILADFWSWLGLADLKPPAIPPQNQTFDWSILDLLSRNPWLFENVQDNRVLSALERLLPPNAPREGHGLLPSSLAGEIMDQYRPVNEMLHREFFPEYRPLHDYPGASCDSDSPFIANESEAVQRVLGQLVSILVDLDERCAANDTERLKREAMSQSTGQNNQRESRLEHLESDLKKTLNRLAKVESKNAKLFEQNKRLKQKQDRLERAFSKTLSQRIRRWFRRHRKGSGKG